MEIYWFLFVFIIGLAPILFLFAVFVFNNGNRVFLKKYVAGEMVRIKASGKTKIILYAKILDDGSRVYRLKGITKTFTYDELERVN